MIEKKITFENFEEKKITKKLKKNNNWTIHNENWKLHWPSSKIDCC